MRLLALQKLMKLNQITAKKCEYASSMQVKQDVDDKSAILNIQIEIQNDRQRKVHNQRLWLGEAPKSRLPSTVNGWSLTSLHRMSKLKTQSNHRALTRLFQSSVSDHSYSKQVKYLISENLHLSIRPKSQAISRTISSLKCTRIKHE